MTEWNLQSKGNPEGTYKRYHINLNDEERQAGTELTNKSEIKGRKFARAMLWLKANEGLSSPQIMAPLNVSRPYVEQLRKRYQR